MLKKFDSIPKDKLFLILLSVSSTLALQKVLVLYHEIRRKGLKQVFISFASKILRNFRSVRDQIEKEDVKARESMLAQFTSMTQTPFTQLPLKSTKDVLEILRNRAGYDSSHRNENRLSGSIYHGGDDINHVAAEAMRLFTFANPLHPEIFPSVRQMDCEIVKMTLEIFHGNEDCCGVLSSGGTESLLLAVLAYREWGRARGIFEPEIVMPETVHAAVSKAAYYFGVHLIKLKIDRKTGLASLRDFERNINSNTVAIFGSAPGFPHGIFDQIEDLGKLALKKRINLHVDACLGGFLIPFVEAAGYPVQPCDFRVKGVTSISCDLHKYGYTPKGVSILMYLNSKLRRYQYFSCPDWPGGLYATPNISGSRAGVLTAGAWAVLMHMGKEGYTSCAREIMEAANYIRENSICEDLQIIGNPSFSIISWTSTTLNPHAVGAVLKRIGRWDLNHLQNPDAFHLCVTYANSKQAKEFVSDLFKAVEIVKNEPGLNDGVVALYGAVANVPDKSIVGELTLNYIDFLFSLK
jgi:sphinganine-1-phosphate aldolase